jgi:uncharacterized protein YndB with AHSA1/START domain
LKNGTSKSMRFYAELYVEQSPATVWSYFSDLTQWSRWSPICLECRLVEGVQLGTGSVMRIRFRVARITTVVLANIISVKSPHVITWTGAKYGLSAVHTYRFERQGSGTLMINEERILGAPFPISDAIRRWYRASDLSFQSLAGIKRELG